MFSVLSKTPCRTVMFCDALVVLSVIIAIVPDAHYASGATSAYQLQHIICAIFCLVLVCKLCKPLELATHCCLCKGDRVR